MDAILVPTRLKINVLLLSAYTRPSGYLCESGKRCQKKPVDLVEVNGRNGGSYNPMHDKDGVTRIKQRSQARSTLRLSLKVRR
jgi:hypothetical protein